MGRRPLLPPNSSNWACGPRFSRKLLPRSRTLVKEIMKNPEKPWFITVSPARVTIIKEDVKKRRRMALLKMALSTPFPSSYPVEITAPAKHLETTLVEEVKYQLGMTVSDDEKDLKEAEEYDYWAERDSQSDGPPHRGYFEPVGKFFKKEEEVKAYHLMFPHIIGEDGLCVYPHCRKPYDVSDIDRAMFFTDRYFGCFQDSFDKLERTRIELQDKEDSRVTMARKTQKPKPSVPPDLILPPTPLRPPKKSRRSKQDKRRVKAAPAVSSLNYQIAELRLLNVRNPQEMDLFSNEVIELNNL